MVAGPTRLDVYGAVSASRGQLSGPYDPVRGNNAPRCVFFFVGKK